jgi:hypothetical protein
MIFSRAGGLKAHIDQMRPQNGIGPFVARKPLQGADQGRRRRIEQSPCEGGGPSLHAFRNDTNSGCA